MIDVKDVLLYFQCQDNHSRLTLLLFVIRFNVRLIVCLLFALSNHFIGNVFHALKLIPKKRIRSPVVLVWLIMRNLCLDLKNESRMR